MDTQAVMVIITTAIVIIVGIWVISVVMSSGSLPTIAAYNESVNFAANNTAYAPSQTNFIAITALYDNPARTVNCWSTHGTGGSGRIGTNSSGFYVLVNGTNGNCSTTGAFNMTVGVKYIDYTYQLAASNSTWSNVTTTIFNSVTLMAVTLIVIAASVILAYFGFGMRAD